MPYGDSGDRVPYGDIGDIVPYGDTASYGDMDPYGDSGDGVPYGDTASYGDMDPYGDSGDGVSYGDIRDMVPYGDTASYGDMDPYGDSGDGVPYGDTGEIVPYGDTGDWVSYGDTASYGDMDPYGDSGDGVPYGDTGDRVPYGDIVPNGDIGDGVPYGDRVPYGDIGDGVLRAVPMGHSGRAAPNPQPHWDEWGWGGGSLGPHYGSDCFALINEGCTRPSTVNEHCNGGPPRPPQRPPQLLRIAGGPLGTAPPSAAETPLFWGPPPPIFEVFHPFPRSAPPSILGHSSRSPPSIFGDFHPPPSGCLPLYLGVSPTGGGVTTTQRCPHCASTRNGDPPPKPPMLSERPKCSETPNPRTELGPWAQMGVLTPTLGQRGRLCTTTGPGGKRMWATVGLGPLPMGSPMGVPKGSQWVPKEFPMGSPMSSKWDPNWFPMSSQWVPQ